MTGTMRVLIIEDSPTMVAWLEAYIKSFSGSMVIAYEVVVTLQQALERLKHGHIDVNLVDINLPNSHGVSTVLQLFASSPTVPIVVLTGDDCGELEEKCIKNGAQEFIRKSDLAAMPVKHFVQQLWHSMLRAAQRKEVIEKYFPVQKQIEEHKKELETVATSDNPSANIPPQGQ